MADSWYYIAHRKHLSVRLDSAVGQPCPAAVKAILHKAAEDIEALVGDQPAIRNGGTRG